MNLKVSKKFIGNLIIVLIFLLVFPALVQAQRFIAWENDVMVFTWDSEPISSIPDQWGGFEHTISVGTTLFVETQDPTRFEGNFNGWHVYPPLYSYDSFDWANRMSFIALSNNSARFTFNNPGNFHVAGYKVGGFFVNVVSNAPPPPPPPQQPPTDDEWGFTTIEELDVLRMIEIAEATQDMIARNGGQRPFSEFRRSFDVSGGSISNNTQAARAAYYQVIVGLLFNDRNLAMQQVNDSTPIEIFPIVGAPAQTLITLFRELNEIGGRRLNIDQVILLMELREHAYFVENGRVVRNTAMVEAIDRILVDFTTEGELMRQLRAIDDAMLSLSEQIVKIGLGALAGKGLDEVFENAGGSIVKAISFLGAHTSWSSDFQVGGVDAARAIQGVRESVWRMWDAQIAEGNANGFSLDSLIMLNTLFNYSRYLTVEQLSWSAIILDGDLSNPFQIIRLLQGRTRWERDVWIQDDINYTILIQTVADYPLFTQFRYGSSDVAPSRIIRFYNDGRFVRRSGWGTSNLVTTRGEFLLDTRDAGRLRTHERDYLFSISSDLPYSQTLRFDNGEYSWMFQDNDGRRSGVPIEMIQWIITLQRFSAPPPQPASAVVTPPATSPWAVEYVSTAIAAGLVPQNLQSNYTNATTRAEFAALAVALYETTTGRTIRGRTTFNDTVDLNVQRAGYLGIVNGVGNGNFNPNGQLTREQAAVMLARLANVIGQPLPQSTPTFADNAQISSWAFEAVGQAQAVGIMGGVGDNRFAPSGDYTREQSIVTILRLFELLS